MDCADRTPTAERPETLWRLRAAGEGALDHLRAAIHDRTDPGPWHRAASTEAETPEQGDVGITVGMSSEGPRHMIIVGAEELTASKARVLAAVLLNAADETDGISTQ